MVLVILRHRFVPKVTYELIHRDDIPAWIEFAQRFRFSIELRVVPDSLPVSTLSLLSVRAVDASELDELS